MSENDRKQKEEEKRVTKWYYEKIGKKNIKFLPIEGVYPDCYVEVDNKKIAIELRRYYNQSETMKNKNLRNMIRNWLKNDKNILEMFVKKIGKPLSQNQTIWYKNIDDIIDDILNTRESIEDIDIKRKNIFFNYTINEYNHTLPVEITDKNVITLEEYLEFIKEYILKGETINLTLISKKRVKIEIGLKYDLFKTNKERREIHNWDIWYEDKNAVFKNIFEAIDDKIKKYEDNYSKCDTLEKYDEYNLIIYPEDVPPTLDEKEIQELDKYLKEYIKEFKFNNIIIFIFNKILIETENKVVEIIC